MAEEWGTVFVKADEEILTKVANGNDDAEAARLLAEAGGVSAQKIEPLTLRTDTVDMKNGYLVIGYDCADFRAFSEIFANHANGIELYARTQDEYGSVSLSALTAAGERLHFEYDQGGDLCDIPEYVDAATAKVEQWIALVPEDVKSSFPDFVDSESLLFFDGP